MNLNEVTFSNKSSRPCFPPVQEARNSFNPDENINQSVLMRNQKIVKFNQSPEGSKDEYHDIFVLCPNND